MSSSSNKLNKSKSKSKSKSTSNMKNINTTTKPSRNNKKTLEYGKTPIMKRVSKRYPCGSSKKVQPWWIGQRLVIKVPNPQTNNKHIIPRIATIKDYFPETKLTQVWYETPDFLFENINLSTLDNWSILNNKLISEQIEFVPDISWVAPQYNIPQKVQVRFNDKYAKQTWYNAFVDAYDGISRRHHINYGDTSEWIWCTSDRVHKINNKQKFADYIEKKINLRITVNPPPWDPYPYGLDNTFKIKSIKLEKNRQQKYMDKKLKQTMVTNNKNETKIHLISSRNTHNMNICLTRPLNRFARKTIKESNKKKVSKIQNKKRRRNKSLQTLSVEPPKKKQRTNTSIIDSVNKASSSITNKIKKYPRSTTIDGTIWKRRYAAQEKKYYYFKKVWDLEKKKKVIIKKWNPWRLINQKAPWLKFISNWQKFYDPKSEQYYYYNQNSNISSFSRPINFESDEEILADSDADNVDSN